MRYRKPISKIITFVFVVLGFMSLINCGGSGGSSPGGGVQLIGSAGGSKASADGKASVVIPSGALSQDTNITVKQATNLPTGNIGQAYEFGPDGTSFSHVVTIDIKYNPANIPAGTNASNLKLGKVVNGQWQIVSDSTVDTATRVVKGETGSFSVYGVVASSDLIESKVGAGDFHTCALLPEGTVKCWGANFFGQVGNEEFGFDSYLIPATVVGISMVTDIAIGRRHSCALLSESTVKCWGDNRFGQLGHGAKGGFTSVPVEVIGINTAIAISAGDGFTCALLSNGTIKCWGVNVSGGLGDGKPIAPPGSLSRDRSSLVPVKVVGINSAIAISAGFRHACAVLSGGSVKCWGENLNGKLGDGTTDNSSTPVDVVGINTATEISTGFENTCVILSGGTVKCWGSNDITFDGITVPPLPSLIPVDVVGISTASKIDTDGHTCVLLSGGTVRCWGKSFDGELGDGSFNGSLIPVDVIGIGTAVDVATGVFHSCAVLSGGRIQCWGKNFNGQLGNGTTITSHTPVRVDGF